MEEVCVYRGIKRSIIKVPTLGHLPLVGDTQKLYRVLNVLYIYDKTSNVYIPIGSGGGGGGAPVDAQYLTLAYNPTLTNERLFTTGDNLIGVDSGANNPYTLTAQIGAFIPNFITVTPSTRQDNYNPVGWNGTYPNIATTIKLNPSTHVVIGGLQGGQDNRHLRFTNVSNYLVILEHEGNSSSPQNRFRFSEGNAFFLLPNQTIELVYSIVLNRWVAEDKPRFNYIEDLLCDGNSGLITTATTNQTGIVTIHTTGTSPTAGGSGVGDNVIGSFQIGTGTSTNGTCKVSMAPRNGMLFTSDSYALAVNKIKLNNLPDVTNNYIVTSGISGLGISNSYTTASPQAAWVVNIGYSASNWAVVFGSGSPIAFNVTSVPLTTDFITLGVFVYGQSEACFFYTNDGVTYTIVQVMTGLLVSGQPTVVGIFKQAGTTTRTMRIDYLASSFRITR